MIDYINYMSKYNKVINTNLLTLLSNIDQDIVMKKTQNKYGSIFDILKHTLYCDVYIFNKIHNLLDLKIESLLVDNIYNSFAPNRTNYECNSISDLGNLFNSIGILYIKVSKDLNKDELSHLTDDQRDEIWRLFYHILNHATHHRGAIQHILNENGIFDDFSGVMQNIKMIEKED